MPIALDPNQTYWLSLQNDANIPLENRSAFQYRYLTYREAMEFSEILDNFFSINSEEREAQEEKIASISDQIVEAAGRKLVGWKNLYDSDGGGIIFDRSKLPTICNLLELIELVRKQAFHQCPDIEVETADLSTAAE